MDPWWSPSGEWVGGLCEAWVGKTVTAEQRREASSAVTKRLASVGSGRMLVDGCWKSGGGGGASLQMMSWPAPASVEYQLTAVAMGEATID